MRFSIQQVCDWRPELMELEDRAKQTAHLLFFVIDNQTRSTASMVEAAHLAGNVHTLPQIHQTDISCACSRDHMFIEVYLANIFPIFN